MVDGGDDADESESIDLDGDDDDFTDDYNPEDDYDDM